MAPPASASSLLPYLLPVMLAALVGGLGPGLAATAAAAGLALFVLFPADSSGLRWSGERLGGLAVFIVEGALVSWLVGGRPRRLQLAQQDVVEEALRRSEERYRAIVDTQAEMVCRFRPDGELLFANGGYARARGTTPEALTGGFVADEDQSAVREMLERLTPEAPESASRIASRRLTACSRATEQLETLFDMFSQVPEHRERTGGGGPGIGLALSRQLIERHGGLVEAKSEGPGRGSEFVVRLPIAAMQPASARTVSAADRP